MVTAKKARATWKLDRAHGARYASGGSRFASRFTPPHDRDRQLAQAIDAADEPVAHHDRGYARRRAGENQIARQQFPEMRQERDRVRHVPDEVSQIAALPALAVHVEPDPALVR